MAYTAFYRKWRPQKFGDVVGQKNIVQALTNQLKAGRVGHAYLFCGTRGTGKTTIAKIMARAVNCENPVDGEPCNVCPTCQAILAGSSVNVVEIDAASNNGVDDIRQIREEVRYAPPQGHYRVYIIDEVHSLTMNAYNALLKTLEEPPSYVMFILATTEAHKIPVTVLSRCQRYDFKRIETDYIFGHLQHLTETEGIPVEEKALRYIAKAADGGMRDALSLLEQCVSCYYGESLTYDKVLEVLGAVDNAVHAELLSAVLSVNVKAAMDVVEQMVVSGKDLTNSVAEYVWFLRNLMLLQTSTVSEEELGISTEDFARQKELSKQVTLDELLRWIRLFSQLQADMKNSTVKRTLLEVAVIRAMRPEEDKDLSGMVTRIERLEQQMAGLATGQVVAVAPVAAPAEEAVSAPTEEIELEPGTYEDLDVLRERWSEIVSGVERGIRGLLDESRPDWRDGKFLLVAKDEFRRVMLQKEEHIQAIADVVRKKTGKEIIFQPVDAGNVPAHTFIKGPKKKVNFDIGEE